jgi:hypothetical protein
MVFTYIEGSEKLKEKRWIIISIYNVAGG